MQIYSKNIYELKQNNSNQNILIIYNISSNHYVGLPIYNKKIKNSIHIPSIDRYVVVEDLKEYNRKNIKRINIC